MAHVCLCGDELTIHETLDDSTRYCQSCGFEEKISKLNASLSSQDFGINISRASVVKKVRNKIEEEPKRPRQIRDRPNYVTQRGRGR
jgi:hypothetical protein